MNNAKIAGSTVQTNKRRSTRRRKSGSPSQISIRLFGRFEVEREGEIIHDPILYRQVPRTLLTVLALNCGNELNCARLARMLWPECSEESQRHNFYNIWSLLRKALRTDAGECPYLERHQNYCLMVKQLVRTDAQDLELLCNELTDPELKATQCVRLYRGVQDIYRSDLLPGEDDAPLVVRARADWRDRVVNALYCAARTLLESGETATALWIAHAAVRLDDTREDVCRLKIRALMDMGNRPAALASYNAMKSYLNEELGLDPTPQSERLFERIVGADQLSAEIPIFTSVDFPEMIDEDLYSD